MKNIIVILFASLFSLSLNAQDDSDYTQDVDLKEKISFKSKMIYNSLKSSKIKHKLFENMINKPRRGGEKVHAKKINKKLSCEERTVDGFYVLTVHEEEEAKKHIIFLHGGAYVAEAFGGHKDLIEKLVRDYNFRVTFIDYPLAPEHQAPLTHKILEKTYDEICIAYKEDVFYLLGDSAGGGLALAFLQTLRNKNKVPFPYKTVLLSPWLDVSMTNPEIEHFKEKDVLLPLDGLRQCGMLYAGDIDIKEPIVSPIYGSLDSLFNIKLFVSNYELFYPDCLLLKEMSSSARSTSITLEVKNKMVHDWAIFPIREAKETICEIADFYLME